MSRKLKMKLVIGGFLVLLFIAVHFSFSLFPSFKAFAQANIDLSNPDITGINSIPDLTGIEEQVDLTVTPENPQPGDTINASVQAFGFDLNRSVISWYINGVKKTSGTGLINFQAQAGGLGKFLTISVKINPPTGARPIEKSFTLSSQNVDIIWEASSYTPPFYKGKPLYGEEGNVVFVAMPNIIDKKGSKVNSSNLVYTWFINDSVIGSKSGYGKNTIYYSGSILAQQDFIQVEVTAPDGTTASGAILLAPRTPITLLYEDNPLYGVMFNQAIKNGYKLKEKEIRVAAYPYFFSTAGKNSYNISYAWALNDNSLPVPSQKNSVVFRNSNNLSGSSKVSVTTDNTTQILQRSFNEATLNF